MKSILGLALTLLCCAPSMAQDAAFRLDPGTSIASRTTSAAGGVVGLYTQAAEGDNADEVVELAAARSEAWRLTVSPLAWTPNLDGNIATRGVSVDFDSDFLDYLSNIEFVIQARIELAKGPLFLYVEGMYIEGGDSVDGPGLLNNSDQLGGLIGNSKLRRPNIPAPGDAPPRVIRILERAAAARVIRDALRERLVDAILANATFPRITQVDMDLTMTMVEFGAGWRLKDWRFENGQELALDGYAGGRYWHAGVEQTFDIKPGSLGLVPRSVSFDQNADWVDPIIGARLQWRVNEKLTLGFRGDIGGFDVGSQFTWSVLGVVDYRFNDRFSIFAGYRALDIDYVEGSGADRFEFDAMMQGPVFGGSIRF